MKQFYVLDTHTRRISPTLLHLDLTPSIALKTSMHIVHRYTVPPFLIKYFDFDCLSLPTLHSFISIAQCRRTYITIGLYIGLNILYRDIVGI